MQSLLRFHSLHDVNAISTINKFLSRLSSISCLYRSLASIGACISYMYFARDLCTTQHSWLHTAHSEQKTDFSIATVKSSAMQSTAGGPRQSSIFPWIQQESYIKIAYREFGGDNEHRMSHLFCVADSLYPFIFIFVQSQSFSPHEMSKSCDARVGGSKRKISIIATCVGRWRTIIDSTRAASVDADPAKTLWKLSFSFVVCMCRFYVWNVQ